MDCVDYHFKSKEFNEVVISGKLGNQTIDLDLHELQGPGLASLQLSVHKSDYHSFAVEPPCSADLVNIAFQILGEVVVDNQVDTVDVDPPSKEIGGHHYSRSIIFKSFVVADSLFLGKSRMNSDGVKQDVDKSIRYFICFINSACKDDGLAERNIIQQFF